MNEDDDSDSEGPEVTSHFNHIYFYVPVTRTTVRQMANALNDVSKQMLKMQIDYDMETPGKIYLHIQSDGGDAFAGLSGMNTIQACKVPVVTIADGFIASAATFLFLGGSERRMQSNSMLLIHQLRTGFHGKFADLQDEMHNSDKIMKKIVQIYSEYSTMEPEKVNEIISKETYLDCTECLNYGLIHDIC